MSSARSADAGNAPDHSASLLHRMVDAINAGNAAAVAALYTPDGSHEDVPAGAEAHGRAGIAAFVEQSLGQLRDPRLEAVASRQTGNLAVIEYRFSGGDVATGRPVAYRGALVFEIEGDAFRRSADYYDLAGILGQTGAAESSAGEDARRPANPSDGNRSTR